jgi:hypothetical protein
MTAGEKLLGIDVSDGAGGGDLEIAANELSTYSGAGNHAGDCGRGDRAEVTVGIGFG